MWLKLECGLRVNQNSVVEEEKNIKSLSPAYKTPSTHNTCHQQVFCCLLHWVSRRMSELHRMSSFSVESRGSCQQSVKCCWNRI